LFKIAEFLDINKHLEYIHLLAKMLALLHLLPQYPPAVVLFSDSILYKYDYHSYVQRKKSFHLFCLLSPIWISSSAASKSNKTACEAEHVSLENKMLLEDIS